MLLSPQEKFNQSELEFPVSFALKIIIVNEVSKSDIDVQLIQVFETLGIGHGNWKTKTSKTKKYVTYSIDIDVKNKEQFDGLYNEMGQFKWVKYII